MNVLLVEDSCGDAELVRQGFMRSSSCVQLAVVSDGVEAVKYLSKTEEYKETQTPCLVLLDVNLPKMSGLEVLAVIREHATLRWIPVVVLTTSSHEDDLQSALKLNANAYVQKPLKARDFIEVIGRIADFWQCHLGATLKADRGARKS